MATEAGVPCENKSSVTKNIFGIVIFLGPYECGHLYDEYGCYGWGRGGVFWLRKR